MSEPVPEWAEQWAPGNARCDCGARVVILHDYTGKKRRVCASSAWDVHICLEKAAEVSQSAKLSDAAAAPPNEGQTP